MMNVANIEKKYFLLRDYYEIGKNGIVSKNISYDDCFNTKDEACDFGNELAYEDELSITLCAYHREIDDHSSYNKIKCYVIYP